MTIPPSEGPGVVGDPAAPGSIDQPDDTQLISRLVNELFREGRGFGEVPRSPDQPLGGVPGGTPALSAVRQAPGQSRLVPNAVSEVPALGGNERPFVAPSVRPPVHPGAGSQDLTRTGVNLRPISGEHKPSSADSYEYGEPRCSDLQVVSGGCNREPRSAVARGIPGVHDSAGAEDLYFLRQREKEPGGVAKGGHGASSVGLRALRSDFPALHQRVHGRPLVWLDNAATTHKPRQVIDATSRFYGRDNSNIHRAAHTLAARSTELFEGGREKARRFLGAREAREIIFVRGTTEAINLVAQSYGRKHVGSGDEIIISELEHHANIVPWQLLAGQVGAVVRVIPINDRGELILEEFARLLGPRTRMVSVAHVSNSLGTINPVEEVIALAHARGVPVLVDGAQSTPHLPVNVTGLDADFYAFSGHKVFGPTGVGVLYGKAALLEAMPPWQGGGHMIRDVRFEGTTFQEAPEKFEAGTPDIAGVVGLGAALDYLDEVGLPSIAAYEHGLLEYATQAIQRVPGIRLIGTALNKASVISFVIPGIPNEKIAKHLDRDGIAVRAGHHCAQPAQRHFGLESTVRASLAFYNTLEEIDSLVSSLLRLVKS